MKNSAKTVGRKDWHPADIKAALEKRGWTLRGLAVHHGIRGSSSFSYALTNSHPINEKRIADAIGVPVQEIWPSRYYPDGVKRPRGLRGERASRLAGMYAQRNARFVVAEQAEA